MTAEIPPRIVTAYDVVQGWSEDERANLCWFVAAFDPDVIDAYDVVMRKLAEKKRARSTQR